jgi:hypothetical protein
MGSTDKKEAGTRLVLSMPFRETILKIMRGRA